MSRPALGIVVAWRGRTELERPFGRHLRDVSLTLEPVADVVWLFAADRQLSCAGPGTAFDPPHEADVLRRHALERATERGCDYIMHHDNDDWHDPLELGRAVAWLRSDPGASLVWHDHALVVDVRTASYDLDEYDRPMPGTVIVRRELCDAVPYPEGGGDRSGAWLRAIREEGERRGMRELKLEGCRGVYCRHAGNSAPHDARPRLGDIWDGDFPRAALPFVEALRDVDLDSYPRRGE